MRMDPPPLAGRYDMGDQIGAGGSARVYRATDRRLGRQVAIKILDESLAESADPAARQRFEIESRTSATFTHPNAVTVFDAGSDQGSLYLVMELVTGGSLAQRLAIDARLPSAEVARLGSQVASALAAAHALGIIHRDVKPSNILLDDRGDAKLADFGIAQRFDEIEDSLTSTGMVMGTRQYVSPEQVAGRTLGPATDVYSLGIVLFEAVTGRRPAPALERDRESPLDPLSVDPSIEPGLAAVIVRATEITVDARSDSAEQMARALSDAFVAATGRLERAAVTGTVLMPAEFEPTGQSSSALPVEVQPNGAAPPPTVPLAQRLTRERRQRRRLLTAVMGAVAIVTLLAVVGLFLGDDDTTAVTSEPATSLAAPPPLVETAETRAIDAPSTTTSPSTSTSATVGTPVEPRDVIVGFPVPDDVEQFITLLRDHADVAGGKADDLARQLDALVVRGATERDGENGKVDRDAEKLTERIDKWVRDDELDPLIADLALDFIDGLR